MLDINFKKEGEHFQGKTGRAWLVFDDVTDLSLNLNNARLPNGIFSTGPMAVTSQTNKLRHFSIPVLLPRFDQREVITGTTHGEILITAKGLRPAVSGRMMPFGKFGPGLGERQASASDQALLDALTC